MPVAGVKLRVARAQAAQTQADAQAQAQAQRKAVNAKATTLARVPRGMALPEEATVRALMARGLTENGATWCAHALNPSDATASVRGLPDSSSARPVIFRWTYEFPVNAGVGRQKSGGPAVGTFDMTLDFCPNGPSLGCIDISDSADSDKGSRLELVNTQLSADVSLADQDEGDSNIVTESWLAKLARWRVSAASITLTNTTAPVNAGGSISAAQTPLTPTDYNFCYPTLVTNLDWIQGALSNYPLAGVEPPQSVLAPGPAEGYHEELYTRGDPIAIAHIMSFDDRDHGSVEVINSEPNKYAGAAKDGIYMPLKLTEEARKWRSSADVRVIGPANDAAPGSPASWKLAIPEMEQAEYNLWPYYTACGISTNQSVVLGGSTLPPMNGLCGHVLARGLPVGSSFLLKYVFTVEAIPQPGILSAMAVTTPTYDPAAWGTYVNMSLALPDAWPAAANATDAVGSAVKPLLDMIPIVGPLISAFI